MANKPIKCVYIHFYGIFVVVSETPCAYLSALMLVRTRIFLLATKFYGMQQQVWVATGEWVYKIVSYRVSR